VVAVSSNFLCLSFKPGGWGALGSLLHDGDLSSNPVAAEILGFSLVSA
jgi:hypothetical protein